MDSASGHTLGRWEASRSGSALTLKSPWLCCGSVMGEHVQKVKKQFMAARDVPEGGRIWTEQLVSIFLSEDESPLDSSVQFMQARSQPLLWSPPLRPVPKGELPTEDKTRFSANTMWTAASSFRPLSSRINEPESFEEGSGERGGLPAHSAAPLSIPQNFLRDSVATRRPLLRPSWKSALAPRRSSLTKTKPVGSQRVGQAQYAKFS
ncbi:secretagogin [Molossus nigricans]